MSDPPAPADNTPPSTEVEEDFLPFLEATGWKIVTLILLAYWALRALGWIWAWMYYMTRYCKCCRQSQQKSHTSRERTIEMALQIRTFILQKDSTSYEDWST